MFEQVNEVRLHYDDLYNKLNTADYVEAAEINKELKTIGPLVNTYIDYLDTIKTIDYDKSLLDDPELSELAKEEITELNIHLEEVTNKLTELLQEKDPNDDANTVMMEIRAGTGGEESSLFAYDLYRMYTMYADSQHWLYRTTFCNESKSGGFKEVDLIIRGKDVYSKLKYESGVHRVQRVPETESQGRIHTSACSVAIMPELKDVDIEINENDLKIDTFRASGAGGQHVNRTESAIRITHIPTGVVVECQDERSQYKNKDRALKNLKIKLLAMEREKQEKENADLRKSQVGTGDRSERIRTYNFPQDRVTDHRINLTLYNIEKIMNGNLDDIVNALKEAEKLESLK